MFIETVLIANGIFDLLCAASILYNLPFFQHFHLDMIPNEANNFMMKRFLAYWILTNGFTRLVCGFFFHNEVLRFVTALTYFNEAWCFFSDAFVFRKMLFVCISSIILGFILTQNWVEKLFSLHTLVVPTID
jgi:Erg28 like protein